ncbi:glycosyltransferase family 2 protein [Candidatus Woesearchaeota archaeon]|nr:glycosyltransferase family 2 protein [Candidatus Woesearchaeota archaeon]
MNWLVTSFIWFTYVASLYFTIYWILLFVDYLPSFVVKKRNNIMTDFSPFVSVLVPAFNEEDTIEKTIRSIYALDHPKDKYEVIVINDASTDNTEHVLNSLKKEFPSLIILENKINIKKAASLNRALEIAKGEFFACLDADSFVDHRTLKRMLAKYVLVNDPDVAIITPAMKVYKPKTIIQKFQRIEYILFLFIARLLGFIDCIQVAPGPFSLYKTKVIQKLGGFDCDNPAEDMEIAYKVQFNQYKIIQCPNGYVYTVAPSTIKELYHQRRYRWLRGGLVNTLKYKKIIFNKDYGDFGIIQALINLMGYFLAFCIIGLFGYFFIRPVFNLINDASLYGFDFFPFIKSFEWTFSFWDFEFSMLLINVLLLLLGVLVFYLAHKNASEHITEYGLLHIVPYFFLYYIFLSIVAVIVVFDHACGKRWKW